MRQQPLLGECSKQAQADANFARSAPHGYSERSPLTDAIEENPDAQGAATRT